MTNLRFRWALFIAILVIFGFYLLPTVRLYSMPASERKGESVASIREDAMRLGLDLQGGSYLVYEVNLDKLKPEEIRGDELERAIEIIRNRVDQFGVSEPVIQKQGDDRIVVQLPGLQDPERAKELVGKTARLDFRLVKTQEEMFQALNAIDRAWSRRGRAAMADSAQLDSLAALDAPFSQLLQQAPGQNASGLVFVPRTNHDKVEQILGSVAYDTLGANQRTPRVLAGGTYLLWGAAVGEGGPNPGRYLYAVSASPELTGDRVSDAVVSFGLEPQRPQAAGVSLTMDRRGAAVFTRVTGANVGRQLAIVLDDVVQSAPFIRDKIRGGRASITGLGGDAEAKDLGIVLRAGALPTDLVAIEERTVGPSLGRDSIDQGVKAALVGLCLVLIVMIIWYRASGFLAVLALGLNLFFLFSVLGMLRGTLTLPGIAGIVLTIGMAVDANVLVFERIREELRAGKTVRGAIDAGYGRALVTILDSNLTTLIASIVLFQFGTGPIRGFALTLMIGIVANIFTAVFVTRLIYDSWMTKRTIKTLSI